MVVKFTSIDFIFWLLFEKGYIPTFQQNKLSLEGIALLKLFRHQLDSFKKDKVHDHEQRKS